MSDKIIMKRFLLMLTGLLLTMGTFAQSIVKGNVKDANGEPLLAET